MIRSGLILMIKDLAGKGKSAYAIGQEIGVSKNTARKYMTQPAQPHGLKGIGHSIGTSQIYYVLHRHGWRKVMPAVDTLKRQARRSLRPQKNENHHR